MPGLHRSRPKNRPAFFFAFPVLAGCLLLGCKAPEETGRQELPRETLKDFLTRYEKTFDPTQYDVQIARTASLAFDDSLGKSATLTASSAPPETTAGFRVQVLTTQDIDQAVQLRDTLSAALQDDWVYIVHDAPYYKVRVGNYTDRPSANKTVKTLIEEGYSTAWVVPDQVLKNPPPKPLAPPANQPEHPEQPQQR
jgi:hypothetical protein